MMETPVLVVGAGPAGLIAAIQLARNGTRCVLVKRNLDSTKWPKMDITNCRSMELLKRLGLDQGLRDVGMSPMRVVRVVQVELNRIVETCDCH
jgi:FAD-dependent monooxygenase